MKSPVTFILLLLFFSFGHLSKAQLVTKKDTIEGTELSISADRRISNVITELENTKCTKRGTSKTANRSKSDNRGATTTSIANTINNSANKTNRKLTNAEICRKNPRILGVKIQLVVVKSKAEADEVALYFRRRFPYIKVQQDASLRPNYKVLAGSYFSKEDAAKDLKKIRAYFKGAIPVKYMIFCTDAL